MIEEPYLILHKVRGEPAFDIAIKLRCSNCQGVGGHLVPDFETGIVTDYEGLACDECDGTGYWWIIPTSGHRAYPYWWEELDRICEGQLPHMTMPNDCRDHYEVNASSDRGPKLDISSLIAATSKPLSDRRF